MTEQAKRGWEVPECNQRDVWAGDTVRVWSREGKLLAEYKNPEAIGDVVNALQTLTLAVEQGKEHGLEDARAALRKLEEGNETS